MSSVPLPSFGRLGSRTNLKPVSGGRHRDAETREPDVDHEAEDHEFTSYLAALAPEADPESTGSGRRFGDAQVYQLRVSLIASQQLKDLAIERGTSPQALAQEWLLERLAWESEIASQSAAAQWPSQEQVPRGGVDQQRANTLPPRRQRLAEAPREGQLPQRVQHEQHAWPEPETDKHFFESQGWEQPMRGSLR